MENKEIEVEIEVEEKIETVEEKNIKEESVNG